MVFATRMYLRLGGVAAVDGAYELRVELGQPWLALAIKDQKGVDHVGSLCELGHTQGDGQQPKWSTNSVMICCEMGSRNVTPAGVLPRLRDVTAGKPNGHTFTADARTTVSTPEKLGKATVRRWGCCHSTAQRAPSSPPSPTCHSFKLPSPGSQHISSTCIASCPILSLSSITIIVCPSFQTQLFHSLRSK